MLALNIALLLVIVGFLCWLVFILAVYALPLLAGVTVGVWACDTGARTVGAFLLGAAAAGAVAIVGQLLSLERQSRAQAAAVRSGLNQQVRLNWQLVGNAWARMNIAVAQIQAADPGSPRLNWRSLVCRKKPRLSESQLEPIVVCVLRNPRQQRGISLVNWRSLNVGDVP